MSKQIFDSMAEMTQAADEAWQAGRREKEDEEFVSESRWIGRPFSSWADVVQKVGEYWPEGLDLMQEMLFELRSVCEQARPKSRVRRARWSADDGDEIDLDRLRSGQEFWRQMVRETHDAPQHISVCFGFSTSASTDAEAILWRGAVAIILADLLENCGYRVEVWGIDHARHVFRNGDNSFHAVRLKASEVPVDIATLVNGVAGWFYRTVVFQANYIKRKDALSSLGGAGRIDENNADVKELIGNAQFVVIDGIWDRHAAERKILEVMKSLNV